MNRKVLFVLLPVLLIISTSAVFYVSSSVIGTYQGYWRGFYVKEFSESITWSVVIPSLFFSLWHIAPQFSIKADNMAGFIISTLPLGLTYALVAYATKSAKWSVIGHGISGILSYSGLLSYSVYKTLLKG